LLQQDILHETIFLIVPAPEDAYLAFAMQTSDKKVMKANRISLIFCSDKAIANWVNVFL
jgi:hypothetical protein